MAKRQQLNYNNDELVQHLRQSTGQGVDALFSPPSPPRSVATTKQQAQTGQDESIQTSTRARTHLLPQAETGVSQEKSVQTDTHASMHARIVEALRHGFLNRRHLSSFTFRFRAQELEDLDQVAAEVNREVDQKISKNDIVRLGLNWLLQDYQHSKQNSVLASVLRRV
jgi:hypothetical protein